MNYPNPMFIDSHCHLDLYPDMEALMKQCERDSIQTIAVTTTPRAWPKNRELARQFLFIEPALGLYPQLVGSLPSELDIWDSYVAEARVIGEAGFDARPRFYKTLEEQRAVFAHILQACAKESNKVLSVHSVRAAKMVLDMVEKYLPGSGCTVILHWFTGTQSEARRAIELGCYLSINMEMIQKPTHIKMIASLPVHRIFTETDGPFTKNDNGPCSPCDVSLTVAKLADILNIGCDEL